MSEVPAPGQPRAPKVPGPAPRSTSMGTSGTTREGPQRHPGAGDQPTTVLAGAPPARPGAAPARAADRQAPFYCPYCGEEELRPATAAAGSWQCGACARAFELRFAGLATTRQLPS